MNRTTHRITVTLVGLLALSMIFACQRVEQSKIELTQNQWQDIQEYILDDRPDPDHLIEVEFGEKVELIGVDIDGEFKPGEAVELVWYWHVLEDVDDDWQIFVHFDSEEARFRQNLDHYPLGEEMNNIFRTYHWQQGHIIADVQRFTVRDDYPAGEARFYVGLFRGEQRSSVSNDGPATDDDRALGPVVEIDGPAQQESQPPSGDEQPTHTVPQLNDEQSEELQIDGAIDESFWRHVPALRLAAMTPEAVKHTTVQLTYTDSDLVLAARIHDDQIQSDLDESSPQLWTHDALQLMMAPQGPEGPYAELTVSPHGAHYGAIYDAPPSVDQAQAADAERGEHWTPTGLDVAVQLSGDLEHTDGDEYWTVEMRVPLAAVPGAADDLGEWRFNIYRFDGVDHEDRQIYGWATAVGETRHQAQRFGTIRFGDELQEVPQLRRAEGQQRVPEELRQRVREAAAQR